MEAVGGHGGGFVLVVQSGLGVVLYGHSVLTWCRTSVITLHWWCCLCSNGMVQGQGEHIVKCANMVWMQYEDMVVVLWWCCQCSNDMVQGHCEHIVLHEHSVLT